MVYTLKYSSLVVPVYNEKQSILPLHEEITGLLSSLMLRVFLSLFSLDHSAFRHMCVYASHFFTVHPLTFFRILRCILYYRTIGGVTRGHESML